MSLREFDDICRGLEWREHQNWKRTAWLIQMLAMWSESERPTVAELLGEDEMESSRQNTRELLEKN